MRSCGLMVLVFSVGLCRGADPLDNWTTSNFGTQNSIQNVVFGNSRFVAVGAGGTIVTSPDAVAWDLRNSGATNGLGAVAYGGGQFVVLGGLGTFITSLDGVIWMPHNVATTIGTIAITYGNGRFVAAGGIVSTDSGVLTNAAVISSSDGINWTPWYWTPDPNRLADPTDFSSVAYGNGRFVAVSSSYWSSSIASVATSPDGITWTQHYDVDLGQGANALTFGNGLFVAVGGYPTVSNNVPLGHAIIYTSTNGISWTLRADVLGDQADRFNSVAFGGGEFVASGEGTYSSPDGTNWVPRLLTGTYGLAYGSGRFVAVGGNVAHTSGVIGRLGASLGPANGVLGTITGVTGQNYTIQTSADLAAWTVLTNVTIVTNGTAKFSDPAATNASRRFYGAVLRQP